MRLYASKLITGGDRCDEADVIAFVVSGKEGIMSCGRVCGSHAYVNPQADYLAVNKWISRNAHEIYDFYALGLGDPFCVSSVQIGTGF